MTPETGDQEDQVARILAETARHEPVPPLPTRVQSRLDDVLGDLVAARDAAASTTAAERDAPVEHPDAHPTDTGATLHEVADRRGRRRLDVLTAAAALAVIAGAGAAVATGGFGIGSSPTQSATSADSSARSAAPGTGAPGGPPVALPRLHTSTLAADVQRVLRPASASDGRRPALTGPPGGPVTGCARPTVHRGERLIGVRLDGRPATLLLGAVRSGTREARVYPCVDVARPVARATVRVR